jgi:hypothetical protein
MHADLVKLLDLQAKDAVVSEVDQRITALAEDSAGLDARLPTVSAGETTWRPRSRAIERCRTAANRGWSMCGIPRRPPP